MSEKIRLSAEDAMGRFIGHACDYFLRGRRVDPDDVYEADEAKGVLSLIIWQTHSDGRREWTETSGAGRPWLTAAWGPVEIRLREDAGDERRAAYDALRQGRPEEAERIRREWFAMALEEPSEGEK